MGHSEDDADHKNLTKWKRIGRISWKFWYFFNVRASIKLYIKKIDVILVQCPFNPRLPKVFSITHIPNLRLTCPKYECVWYHSIGEDLPFPLIPKFWKSANVWRHNDVFKHGRPEKADFQGNIGQNWIFAKKSSNYQNFTRFFAYKGGKWCF